MALTADITSILVVVTLLVAPRTLLSPVGLLSLCFSLTASTIAIPLALTPQETELLKVIMAQSNWLVLLPTLLDRLLWHSTGLTALCAEQVTEHLDRFKRRSAR
jgi:hypothetical protein